MQAHLAFQVVTPRTLADFHGATLILPNVRVLNESEKTSLRAYVGAGNKLLITGADVTQLGNRPNVLRFSDDPGKAYADHLATDFEHATPELAKAFLSSLTTDSRISVTASPQVATSISLVAGKPHVFFANFAGLQGGVNPVQNPQSGVQVSIVAGSKGRGFFLPFLGEVQPLSSVQANGTEVFTLPAISKGAVFWYEPAGKE